MTAVSPAARLADRLAAPASAPAAGGREAARLPADCALLPLAEGRLLVSPGHAVFCRVPPPEAERAAAVLAGGAPLAALGAPLLADLARHGFFGAPRPPAPDVPSVHLQITNACNLACRYCCTNSGRVRAREAPREAWREIARLIPETLGPATRVSLLGGEPFLVPWAVELARELLARGLRLTVFSNGLPLADPGLAREAAGLVARGAELRLSLAGCSPAACDGLSGAGRFAPLLEGLRNLAAAGGRATLDLMLVPAFAEETARELPRLRRLLPPGTPLALGILYRGGREKGAHLFADHAALEAALDRIAFEAGETIPAPAPSPLAFRRDGCGCASGRHLNVRSDGALFNCFKMEEQVGHLAAGGFAAAVRALAANPRRASDSPVCAGCPLATLCGGGCRAENILYTGAGDRPPCGPWRVRVLSELLAEDRAAAVDWPVPFLLGEARARGLAAPEDLAPLVPSRHLADT